MNSKNTPVRSASATIRRTRPSPARLRKLSTHSTGKSARIEDERLARSAVLTAPDGHDYAPFSLAWHAWNYLDSGMFDERRSVLVPG